MAARRAKKQTDSEKMSNFYEVLSMCGDPEHAAKLVNIGLDRAFRALRAPDGFDALDKANECKKYYSMSKEQRKSFLTGCILGGIMPRVVFDESNGMPTSKLIYERLDQKERLKCLDMLSKMEGDYITRIGFEDPPKTGQLSVPVREKIAEIYEAVRKKEEVIDFNPLAL